MSTTPPTLSSQAFAGSADVQLYITLLQELGFTILPCTGRGAISLWLVRTPGFTYVARLDTKALLSLGRACASFYPNRDLP